MGTPKHQLSYNGVSLEARAMEALNSVCKKSFLSLPIGEQSEQYAYLNDLESDAGPLAGLQAAFHHEPNAHWVVIACDLPNVGGSDLQQLINAISEGQDAACYLNPYDQVPEGHCTLYSPSAAEKLSQYLANGNYCLRHFVESLNRADLSCEENLLTNLNYPEDFTEWKLQQDLALSEKSEESEKTVKVEYFAKLKQEAGVSQIEVKTSAITTAGLWEECRLRNNLSLKLPQVKVAVNNEFQDWDYQLKAGETIGFMPPFAGG